MCKVLFSKFLVIVLFMTSIGVGATISDGMVAFFSARKTCPVGWKKSDHQGRAILGTTDSDQLLDVRGVPVKEDGKGFIHNHVARILVNVGRRKTAEIKILRKERGIGQAQTYQFTSRSDLTETPYPYIQFLLCEKKGTQKIENFTFPFGAINFFNQKACPTKWEKYKNLNGRFALSSNQDVLKTGETSSTTWDKKDFHLSLFIHPPHTERVSLNAIRITSGAGAGGGSASAGPHDASVLTTSSVDSPVPYVKMLPCLQSTFLEKEEKALSMTPLKEIKEDMKGLTIFYAAKNCPQGWSEHPSVGGRLLLSLPNDKSRSGFGYGKRMDKSVSFPSHKHGLVTYFSVNSRASNLTTTLGNFTLGQRGPTKFSTTLVSSDHTFPYLTLKFCLKK